MTERKPPDELLRPYTEYAETERLGTIVLAVLDGVARAFEATGAPTAEIYTRLREAGGTFRESGRSKKDK